MYLHNKKKKQIGKYVDISSEYLPIENSLWIYVSKDGTGIIMWHPSAIFCPRPSTDVVFCKDLISFTQYKIVYNVYYTAISRGNKYR